MSEWTPLAFGKGSDNNQLAIAFTICYLTSKINLQELDMSDLATTRMSSKGQVVIPEEIRKRLGLKEGSQFVVVGEKDTVILKVISPPTMQEFDSLIAEARKQARRAGLKRRDIRDALLKARGGK